MQNRNKDNDKAFDEFFKKLFDKHDMPNIKNDGKAYHITITDNNTGNVIADTDTNCIVGAFDEGNGTRQVGISKCNIVELCTTCASAKEMVNKMVSDNPLAKLMLTMAKDME